MQGRAGGFLIGAALVVLGCGKKSDPQEISQPSAAAAGLVQPGAKPSKPTAAAAPGAASQPARIEACSMVLSGAASKTVVGLVSLDPLKSPNGTTSVVTDYWLTTAQRETAQSMMERVTGKKRPPGAAGMIRFTLNCGDEHGAISFMPYRMKETDLPQGPGKYAVFPNRTPPDQKGFQVVINAKDDDMYDAVSGELSITHFDARRLAGAFQVKAHGHYGKKDLMLEGKFDFPCESLVGDACAKP